jgi:SAM-dependent methyltransferase
MPLTYDPSIFSVNDIAQAMNIILTPEDSTTEERWQTETPYVADLIGGLIDITPQTILIDYGCGIGRMAKELISRHGCSVVGVDISTNMRALAPVYVQSDRFCVCSPAMLDAMTERGLRADAAIAIWVLQHCYQPADDIARIRRAIRPAAPLFVLNGFYRAVPTTEQGWANDGVDIKAMLSADFRLRQEGRLPREKSSESIAQTTFWALFDAGADKVVPA